MKKIIIITLLLVSSVGIAQDTLYMCQSGVVVLKRAVAQIDSVIFYKPTIIQSNKVTDKDNNVYNLVTIGTQTWMKENLKTTKYNDGTTIPLVTDNSAWLALATPAYCWYNNDATTYKNTYGALYNWYTVNTGNICPIGFHVPSMMECVILIDYLGGNNLAGGMLKETGTTHWASPNTSAGNSSGFTALPAGYRYSYDGNFGSLGDYAFFWSDTENEANSAWYSSLTYYNADMYPSDGGKSGGLSVRCLQDN